MSVKLGWSKPSGTRPSVPYYGGYGQSGPGTGRKNSKMLDAFTMSKIGKMGEESSPVSLRRGQLGSRDLAIHHNDPPSKVTSPGRATYRPRAESQEELRVTQHSQGSADDVRSGVVITKSWLVTNAERQEQE